MLPAKLCCEVLEVVEVVVDCVLVVVLGLALWLPVLLLGLWLELLLGLALVLLLGLALASGVVELGLWLEGWADGDWLESCDVEDCANAAGSITRANTAIKTKLFFIVSFSP